MAPTRAFASPIITGQKVSAAQFNALDDGQYNAVSRDGVSTLLSTSLIFGDSFELGIVLSDHATSKFAVYLGNQDAVFDTSGGGGSLQVAADRLKLTGASGWPVLDTARTLTNKAVPFVPSFDPATWSSPVAAPSYTTTLVDTIAIVHLSLGPLPPGLTLTGYRVDVKGATGGTLPGTMPTTTLARYAAGAYAVPTESVGTQADTSGSNAVYVADHAITKTGLSHAVDADSHYVLSLTSGYGGGAAAGFVVYRVFISGTISTLRAV